VAISISTTAIHTISDILTIICFITIVSNNQQSKIFYLHKIGNFLIDTILQYDAKTISAGASIIHQNMAKTPA